MFKTDQIKDYTHAPRTHRSNALGWSKKTAVTAAFAAMALTLLLLFWVEGAGDILLGLKFWWQLSHILCDPLLTVYPSCILFP